VGDVAVTVTPGSGAPVLSFATPEMETRELLAIAGAATRARAASNTTTVLLPFLSFFDPDS